MEDINFEDLEDRSSTKPVVKKFAPKNSKFKPPTTNLPIPKSEPPAAKLEEEEDSKQNIVAPPPDESDIIVREIDIYFAPSSLDHPDSKLYVLQYPLWPSWRPLELEDRCDKVRLDPKTSDLEVEMSARFDSENFDADVGDDRAMKKQVLSSAWHPPATTRHAVGILIGDKLHLNPVHAVVQLRPSFQHLKPQHPTHDEEMIVPIKDEKTIKQSKKQRKLPGVENEQNEDTKEWMPLNYHGAMSQLSRGYMEDMIAQQASPIQFPMNQLDYIDSLCHVTSDKLKSKGPSRSSLLKLPLEERYKICLLEGPPVHRFQALKHLSPDHCDEYIFTVLQKHAHLVQGLWVAKSKLKLGTDTGEKVLLRNYALLQFSKTPVFHERQLPTKRKETMTGILDEFAARRDLCRDWKFKELTDDSFIKEYPEIVEEQQKIWDLAEPQIMEALFRTSSKLSIGVKSSSSDNSTIEVALRTTNVASSRTEMLDETREALPKALQKVFQAYKVCSLNQIRQRLRDMAVSENTHRKGTREARASAAAADAPLEELLKTLNQVAVDIHGSFVSRSSPDHPQYDEFRKVVIDLFLAEGRSAKLKKASIHAAANVKLKRDITTSEYQKVLNELCVSQRSAWVLKSGDSPT
uniref:DNA-directed RNA polymerase III subunit RPC5-like n=1 Tax=Erigeron canadensis TaxID=72917 RepID=UPI001CB929CC|nr:DNA-directed RNA polymerase III subunit RPC5-like [Erigeron canadensis]XP_043632140.1 DNA-directed RNA polymerase III subunit RPC5-like [Erigeron canadensis]XP_043632141.1 DNA-directed RNA polymerase III subunit RPC5-like [Erigeron canadensis]